MYVKSKENSNKKNKDKKNKVLNYVKNEDAVYNVLELRALTAHGIYENLNLLHIVFRNLYL